MYVYSRQTAQKRAESFISLRAKLKENSKFKEICDLLESEGLARWALEDKRKKNASQEAIGKAEAELKKVEDKLHAVPFMEKKRLPRPYGGRSHNEELEGYPP